MIKGLGNDIVAIERIEDTYKRLAERFSQRILTQKELQELSLSSQPERYLAKHFCVKEACAKALGTGIGRGVSWQHMQIEHDQYGKPLLILTAGALQRMLDLSAQQVHVSLSDEIKYVVATVILE
jgi:holo-[acyl-carrier protein] synthase